MAHMLGSKVIKTHFELDFFFSLESTSNRRRHWLEIQGCTDAEECGDARMCNVHPVVLIRPELCHTKGSKCCVHTEGGGREPSGRKHDPHVCRKWSCW